MTEASAPMLVKWLAFSQDGDIPLCLSREEARRRAAELRRFISEGVVSPEDVEVTDESKDVLWALTELISDSSDAEAGTRLSEADRIYWFVCGLNWGADLFDEQQEILRRIAAAGWAAVGLTVEELAARRQTDCGILQAGSKCQEPRAPGLVDGFSFARDPTQPADLYAAMRPDERSDDSQARYLSNIDAVVAILRTLKYERDRSPEKVAAEAVEAYKFVSIVESVGLFDEREYVLGELAHLAAGAKRFLGQREEVEFWLCRAEAAFRQTVKPACCLTQVSYTRLALLYDMGRYEDVLELLPDLRSAFADLGLTHDYGKAGLFHAMVLKALNRTHEARSLLQSLEEDSRVRTEIGLYGRILVDLGDTEQLLGNYEKAIHAFRKALPLLEATRQPMAVADLQSVVGSTLRNIGRFAESAEAFAEAKAGFAALGMRAAVAYISILRADALLAASRYGEADMELLEALPTIEEKKMVPEGFAAVALLKESVRRRKTDPNALRELREHLQANR